MKGSEKQIAWATDILSAKSWAEVVDAHRVELVEKIASFDERGKVSVADKKRTQLGDIDRVSALFDDQENLSAEMIVDNRGIFNFANVNDASEMSRKAARICEIIDLDCY